MKYWQPSAATRKTSSSKAVMSVLRRCVIDAKHDHNIDRTNCIHPIQNDHRLGCHRLTRLPLLDLSLPEKNKTKTFSCPVVTPSLQRKHIFHKRHQQADLSLAICKENRTFAVSHPHLPRNQRCSPFSRARKPFRNGLPCGRPSPSTGPGGTRR